jgi:HAD superfamily hydrolase (TIGR01509 family)
MSLIKPHIKLLIFDCDGTLIDTALQHYSAWRDVYQKADGEFITLIEHHGIHSGMQSTEIAASLNKLFGHELEHLEVAREKEKIFLERYIHQSPAIKKTVAIVEQYQKKLPMAVASNGHRHSIHRMLEANHLKDHFDIIITIEDVKHAKPAPDMFLKAADHFKVLPANCLVFEDSFTGFEAAERAGMEYIDVADLV